MRSVLCLLTLALGATAAAQDIDILARDQDDQVDIAFYNRDTNTVVETRAFIGRFDGFYSVNNPGFGALAGSDSLPASEALEWDFLPMTHEGYTSNLLYWDGQGAEPDFGGTPTDLYELSLFGINGTSGIAAGEDEIVTGGTIDFTSSSGALHAHQFFFLDDNGDLTNNTLPEAGFYLLAMRLRIDGLLRSDPYYIAWGTPDSSALTHSQVVMPWLNERVDTLVLRGDHNFDGVVDAADYTVWRDGLGATHTQADADDWIENYGATNALPAASFAIPEPSAVLLGLAMLTVMPKNRRIAR